ncbi:Uncharacterized protein FKW44_008177 [Caligus rogercresseyi]|uniref:Uncharacterized protein n=1 Tax=Caligus rogercresseyi TaxID=217165 RepID=A0A7T8KFX7_CALRO|nr:Uncharacterized protein FKW44_008177 [Caligus rogercresseyi]
MIISFFFQAICALVLCSAISIDAGRTSPPLSSYGAGPVAAGSSFVPVAASGSSFGGSSAAGSSFSGSASAGPAAPVVAILSETNNAPGTLGDNSDFDNAFEAENGLKVQSSGSTVGDALVMKGSYEYIGDDERIPSLCPSSSPDVAIPFPEIAAAVEAQIAFAAQEDAAGGPAAAAGGFVDPNPSVLPAKANLLLPFLATDNNVFLISSFD